MAFISGKTGSATFNSVTFQIQIWSANSTAEALDTTHSGSAGFGTNLAGIEELDGQFKLVFDDTVAVMTTCRPGTSAALVLNFGTSAKSITCTARITSASVENVIRGLVEVTVSFKSNGSVTLPS